MAQLRNDDAPKTFREVGYILTTIQEDVDETKAELKALREQQRNLIRTIMVALVFPLIVGGVLGYLFHN
jgi:hypothetical protein